MISAIARAAARRRFIHFKIGTMTWRSQEEPRESMVIGGGVVGASVLYHLTKGGWKTCC